MTGPEEVLPPEWWCMVCGQRGGPDDAHDDGACEAKMAAWSPRGFLNEGQLLADLGHLLPDGRPPGAPPRVAGRVKVAGNLFKPEVPETAVYVGRRGPRLAASRWANPHKISGSCATCGRGHASRASAVRAYAQDLEARSARVADARRELAGLDLACWCPIGQPCHADVLAALTCRCTHGVPGENPHDGDGVDEAYRCWLEGCECRYWLVLPDLGRAGRW